MPSFVKVQLTAENAESAEMKFGYGKGYLPAGRQAKPISVTYNGNVKKPNNVTVRRNGYRYPYLNPLTIFVYHACIL